MKVLIAEDGATERLLLRRALERLGQQPLVAADGAEAWELFRQHGADVIISDWQMPRMDGPELCQRVRAHPGSGYTYFVMLTALGDKAHVLEGMHAGADDYLVKPFVIEDLEARLIAAERVTTLHRRREAQLRLARRLAVETNPAQILTDLESEAAQALGAATGSVYRWDDERRALATVGDGEADKAIEASPERIAVEHAIARRAPVILQSPRPDDVPLLPPPPDLVHAVLAVPLLHEARVLGGMVVTASDEGRRFTIEDMEVLEVLASSASATLVGLERTRLLQRLADTDGLTGLANRARATGLIQHFLRLAARQNLPVSVGILDLDHFKQVNDRRGHAVGDAVLQGVADLLVRSLRSADVVARWGGEEFLVGLYGMSAAATARRLESILEHLRRRDFGAEEDSFQVSFSAGVAEHPTHGDDLQALYVAADAALYRAKAAGRARVLAAESALAAGG
jgi:diguanylate cyclase (GGDEF)-like protein